MIEFINSNKEWLFSGVGVFFLGIIGSIIFKIQKGTLIGPNSEAVLPPESNNQIDQNEAIESEETEVEKISKRFHTILELMNEDRSYSQFTIPQLAQIMKLHKVSELENVFIGQDEPTFQFINDFCETFGVNKNWLTEGKEHPFSNNDQTKSNPLCYFENIESINPKGIYFIRANTDTAQTFILLKISNWKYKILHRTWHISGHVGAGGRSQLLSFYMLINKLRGEKDFYMRCGGLTLEENDFNALNLGNKFPGKFIDTGRSEDPWWDDLTDINHRYPIAENYEFWHGKSFIKAQEIIKWQLEEAEKHD